MKPKDKFTLTRLEIVRCAEAIFSKRGYHGSSLASIATALDMTKSNLFYYFKNKQQILYFCHEYSLDYLLESLQEAKKEDSSPVAELHALIKAFVRVVVDELQGTRMIVDLDPLSPSQYRKVCAKRDKFESGVRRIVARGMESGVFQVRNPKLSTFAILGALNWISFWVDPEGPANASEIGDVFADYLVEGLLVSNGRLGTLSPRVSRSEKNGVAAPA
jgi:AcrR family transcriptional regulator